MEKYEQWDSTWSFIFAMIGCAIGLGNIWRFSYVVYSNGGGSFFIPYFVAIAIMGVPFLILEYGMGFSFKCAFTDVFKRINPKFEFIAWILIFLIAGGSDNLSNIWNFLLPISVGVIITWFILWFISHKSINQGIGVASKILIPSVFVIMIIIVIYALTLPGAMIGINALLNPNWNALLDVNIWLVAFSQIIFSLGMGEAMALTYASYLSDNSKLSDNVLIVVASNSSFEIFTAFGVFSILGYMSATSGTPLAEIVSEGTGLIFVVFPKIFDLMGFMGHILAPLFFIAILFAGISSAFAFFEPIIGSISSKMNIPRKKLVTILCIIGCVCSLLLTCGISSYLVGIIDGFVNKFGILILVAIQCIIFGWYYGAEKLIPIINRQSTIKVGSLWKNIIKYILPTFIFIIWIVGIVELFVNSKAFELIIYSGIIIIVLLLSTVFYRIKD